MQSIPSERWQVIPVKRTYLAETVAYRHRVVQSGTARTESISITVDADAARTFCQASPEERRKMEILLALRLRELTSRDARSLEEVMDEIGAQAEAKGLTPEMVESMLRDE